MWSIVTTVFVFLISIRLLMELRRLYYRKPFVWITENQWAVVTGATDGIGYEFARQLALKGYHLLLISRNEHKLEATKLKVSDEVRQRHPKSKIQIRTHAADFTRLDIYEGIQQFLDTKKNQIFVLVNNVGTAGDLPNGFLKGNYQLRNEQIINANLISCTRMTELVLPSMVDKRRGLVINISSASSITASPMLSIYAATKSYMNKLAECLSVEYSSYGITFCTLPVFIVSTNMTHNISNDLWVPSPAKYVQSALQSIKYTESCQITGYLPHTLMNLAWHVANLIISPQYMSIGMNWYFKKMRKYFQAMEKCADEKKKPLNLLTILKD